jgi:signal transduction histidine kinase
VTSRAEPRRPLARRLRLSLFAVGALCIAVAVGVFYVLWSRQAENLRLTELERQVGVIGSGVAVAQILPASAEDTAQARARLLKVEAGLIGARLAVTDGTGTVLYSTAGSVAAREYPVSRLATTGTEFDARGGFLDVAGVGRVAVAAVPVSFSGPGVPERYLVGARPVTDVSAGDRWVIVSIGAAALVALLVAGLLGSWLTRRITAPLERLTDGARAVAAGEWGRQVAVEGDDEVAGLAIAFNEMSVRVADAYRAQQEFVGDVSHELRTPITSIRGFSDAVLDGTISDEAGVHRAAAIIRDEADRLADVTSTLLALADLDAGAVEIAREPVDVAAVLDILRDRFDARAAEVGTRLELVDAGGSPLGDADRVVQALSVLVDNALRHAPAGGRVRVNAGVDGARWRADVDDNGPGVAPTDRERVFGRFTRLDASRSSSSGGSGLGLAICRRIVELMGGSVRAGVSPDLGGARFEIELPAA